MTALDDHYCGAGRRRKVEDRTNAMRYTPGGDHRRAWMRADTVSDLPSRPAAKLAVGIDRFCRRLSSNIIRWGWDALPLSSGLQSGEDARSLSGPNR